jgi:hypothetical protein
MYIKYIPEHSFYSFFDLLVLNCENLENIALINKKLIQIQ